MKNRDLAGRGIIGGPKKRRKQMEQVSMPFTAKDALDLWDSGQPIPAFQVEADPERQQAVYAVAFELIRRGNFPENITVLSAEELTALFEPIDPFSLSRREKEVAHSIAQVAKKSGWAKMVSQHVHRDSPAMMIRNPKA